MAPLYEYQCAACDSAAVQESFNTVADRATAAPLCTVCGHRTTLLLSAVPAQFRGVGWAHDGYRTTQRAAAKQRVKIDEKRYPPQPGHHDVPKRRGGR